jgi:hypothetical protein
MSRTIYWHTLPVASTRSLCSMLIKPACTHLSPRLVNRTWQTTITIAHAVSKLIHIKQDVHHVRPQPLRGGLLGHVQVSHLPHQVIDRLCKRKAEVGKQDQADPLLVPRERVQLLLHYTALRALLSKAYKCTEHYTEVGSLLAISAALPTARDNHEKIAVNLPEDVECSFLPLPPTAVKPEEECQHTRLVATACQHTQQVPLQVVPWDSKPDPHNLGHAHWTGSPGVFLFRERVSPHCLRLLRGGRHQPHLQLDYTEVRQVGQMKLDTANNFDRSYLGMRVSGTPADDKASIQSTNLLINFGFCGVIHHRSTEVEANTHLVYNQDHGGLC